MATFYLDFENGNDANDGTTFANRWKTLTNGATAARIAPGDEIRIMGSPAPTSLGQNGVWTSQALQATKNITSATNATPISITCTSHGYSTGDTVVITGVGGNTNANGTWEITVTGTNTFTLNDSSGNGTSSGGTARLRNNTRVMLTTAVTQNIASTGPGRAAWTASANVTATFSTSGETFKEHSSSDSIAIAAGFTTGLAAYWTLPSTLDLSGYQQISFWIQQTTGTIGAAGAIDLRLCSDTTGTTAVNTISIPGLATLGKWMPVTVDLATNLGNSIQSIALYVNTDNGAQTFLLNNIIACKASSDPDSLTLTSLIGKNTTGETFWGIQSINGRRVMLDADTNATPGGTSVRGYYGTSETVTTYKRETIKLGPTAGVNTTLQTIQDSGTDGNPITFSGGWDRTNMSTQNLETWLDGVNGYGFGIGSGGSWITTNNLAGVRFNRAFSFGATQGTGMNLAFIAANNNRGNPAVSITQSGAVNINFLCANSSSPFNGLSYGNQTVNLGKTYSNNGSIQGFRASPYSTLTVDCYNTGTYAINVPDNATGGKITNSEFGDNIGGSVRNIGNQGTVFLVNCLFNDTVELEASSGGTEVYFYSHRHDRVDNNHKIVSHGMMISTATDQRHTASGVSWKIQPTNTTSWNSSRPVVFSLAKVACAANSLVTVKAWMRRDNTGLTMRLVCKGGQIAGVSSDVVSAMTAAADTWEELTITFTPTETGVVEITAEAWGGTTYSGWVDDMTISQA